MDPTDASKVTLPIPCAACGTMGVRLALLTSYGAYCRCDACGHVWHAEQSAPRTNARA
jgi:uncharacterized Zn finger protein